MGKNKMSESKNSLVAYFDILGYQSFLKSNSALETAEKVFELVKGAPKKAIAHWGKSKSFKGDEGQAAIASVKTLVFSDTIVISCPMEKDVPHEMYSMLIASLSIHVAGFMFNDGLPVRGAITFGSFIFDETCIAGEAVVDAHTLCQSLDLAGIAFSPKFSEHVDKSPNIGFWNRQYPYYLFPLKNQTELKARSVPWVTEDIDVDFTTRVREAFWKWNKDIPLSADSKVRNTAKMLDFHRMQNKEVVKFLAEEKV
jgi:hypothetical protein